MKNLRSARGPNGRTKQLRRAASNATACLHACVSGLHPPVQPARRARTPDIAMPPALAVGAEPGGPKRKKRVRMNVDVDVPPRRTDRFKVCISAVSAVLRITEPRPVFLTFEFDSYWSAETDVYSAGVEPKWRFMPPKPPTAAAAASAAAKPERAGADEYDDEFDDEYDDEYDDDVDGNADAAASNEPQDVARFMYETEFSYKLHRKVLVVRLAERSPAGDVEWGAAAVPLDSIARGCQALNMSMIAADGVTCYGNVFCNIAMVNTQPVRALLSDVKLLDYPERYSHDVKLVYFQFGFRGFEDGYTICTERRSEAEPRFVSQPALERDSALHEMILPSRGSSHGLRIFFSVHRQVARTRTEEIGLGALPVSMLFAKVTDGWMNLPTKFQVPLANYKGTVKGKVLLRNIPQFAQLAGDDLVNCDGVLFPVNVDFNARKLLPWVKLPRYLESKAKKEGQTPVSISVPPGNTGAKTAMYGAGAPTGAGSVAATMAAVAAANTGAPGAPGTNAGNNVAFSQYCSPITESASETASESSSMGHLPSSRRGSRTQGSGRSLYDSSNGGESSGATLHIESMGENRRSSATERESAPKSADSAGHELYSARSSVDDVAQASWREMGGLRLSDVAANAVVAADRLGYNSSSGGQLGRRAKSGRSMSSGGTQDGVGEIGQSGLLSTTSDDGGLPPSRDSIGDARASNLLLSSDPPADDMDYDDEDDEWAAIKDPSSSRFYFAHKYTQESLWLPPEWERMEDEDGRQFFVDHGSRSTQRSFPAAKARAYRESVYAG